jgi:hypothetical protein
MNRPDNLSILVRVRRKVTGVTYKLLSTGSNSLFPTTSTSVEGFSRRIDLHMH